MGKIVYKSNKQKVDLLEEIGKGGEASVYLVDKNTVAKIYNAKSLTPEKQNKIIAIINKDLKIDGICLPIETLFDENEKFIGYTMPKANSDKGYEMETCIFRPKLLKIKFPSWTRVNLVNLSLTILNKIQKLHDNNIIIGDINPFNILIRSDSEVYFVDTDSYQVDNYNCPVGTVHFTAPEIQNIENFSALKRTFEHEYFAIATLLFMIFRGCK